MQRVTVSLDDETAAALDAHVAAMGYCNRSEAVRDLVREAASRRVSAAGSENCLGILSYLYDHEQRDLARRLTHTHHGRHDLSLSTLHLHLSRHACLEVAVLQGTLAEIREMADRVSAERGVRLGDLRVIAGPEEAGKPR